jgi:hypothetical protein
MEPVFTLFSAFNHAFTARSEGMGLCFCNIWLIANYLLGWHMNWKVVSIKIMCHVQFSILALSRES